jgi:hypothetical protein
MLSFSIILIMQLNKLNEFRGTVTFHPHSTTFLRNTFDMMNITKNITESNS